MSGRDGSSGDLTAPFIFVPTAWMAAHPDWIKIPATLMPHGSASSRSAVPAGIEATAIAGTAAAVAPGIAEGIGAGFIGGVGELLAAAAAPLAALGILLHPSRTASPDLDELHPGGEGFDPHPAMPPLPGLVPPAAGGRRPKAGRRWFHPDIASATPARLRPGAAAVERAAGTIGGGAGPDHPPARP